MKSCGGPAFPRTKPHGGSTDGMSLRDYFAAKAMQAVLSRIDGPAPWDRLDDIAVWSYLAADEMIKAREV